MPKETNSSTDGTEPGPCSSGEGAGAGEAPRQETRSPALQFNAQTPSSSSVTASTDQVSSVQQQQRDQQGAPTNAGDPQQQYYLHQQHRWPGEQQPPPPVHVGPSGSSPLPPAGPAMQYALPPPPPNHQQQQQPLYNSQQQQQPAQHLGVPGQMVPNPYYGQAGQQQPQQLSPGQRPYPAPHPQMLHPAMMYHHQHPAAYPQHQQYGQQPPHPAATAYWARTNGAMYQQQPPPPPMMGGAQYASQPQQQQMPQQIQQQQPNQEVPSTPSSSSRHTPQPPPPMQQQQQPLQASPSSSSAIGADEAGTTNVDEARPRSRPPQQLQAVQQQPQLMQAPPPHHLRYSPHHPGLAMMPPPHGQSPFPPMGPPPHPQHPSMAPPMHHHYPPHHQPPPFAGPHPGMYFQHPGAPPPPPPHLVVGNVPGMKSAQREAVEKLVMQMANPKQQLTPELVHERRMFFERLVLLNEQQGEVLSGPPQVSKSTVDLYSLYFAVKKKGGFEKTIKDKVWKHMCVEANADMQESSAAGFQLRKHYQKFLLKLECLETGQNAKELVEFAEKQKKKKKDKEAGGGGGGAAGGPPTPSSSKEEQQHGGGGRNSRDGRRNQPQQPQFGTPQGQPFPASAYPTSSAGDYAPYPPPFGQGQHQQSAPPQWFQQQGGGMYSPRVSAQHHQQMRHPTHFGQVEDQGQGPASASRLSSSSTPAPAGDQRPISRASSAVGGDRTVDQQQQQQDEREAALLQQQQRQAPTPSSAFSANAPTPPLTTSTAPLPSASSNALSLSSSAGSTSGAYYASGPYGSGRYPAGGEVYGVPSAAAGIYQSQQPMWSSYTAQQQQQQRYQQQMVASRYYQQSASSTTSTPQQQQPQKAKSGNQFAAPQPPFYGNSRSTGVGVPPGMLPAGPIVHPSYIPSHHASSSWQNSSQFHQFPPHSLEAQTIAQVQQQTKRRRDKVYARDLYGATPARIVMALRSALHMETIWALNALNVQLYDDTTTGNPAPSLAQNPELLNLLVDHLAATLALLFPKHFNAKTLSLHRHSPPAPVRIDESSSLLVPKDEVVDRVELLVPHRAPTVVVASAVNIGRRQQPNNNSNNFTLVSRLGRCVKLHEANMPPELARELEALSGSAPTTSAEDDDEKEDEAFPHFVERVRRSVLEHVKQLRKHQSKTAVFNGKAKVPMNDERTAEFWEAEEGAKGQEAQPKTEDDCGMEDKEGVRRQPRLFYRLAYSWERWGANADRMDDGKAERFALVSRHTVLQDRHSDELMAELINRCLALANVLRGFVFLPAQEKALAQHRGLLHLLPALMMLMVEADSGSGSGRKCEKRRMMYSSNETASDTNSVPTHATDENDIKHEEKDKEEDQADPPSQQHLAVPAEQDSRRKWLLEVANQLRDDAFVILAQLSAQLDLFDLDSAISWPIFDALLHWCVSEDLQARDPLPPFGAIAPRHYALECLCKMSVMERNVDLLVSTGPWPRFEAFVRLLCAQICEEPPVREFAIVILNAVCAACEPACYVAAVETPLLGHLVSFLEAADANMTQIVQQQGMQTLRENPEIIGTSVGMLRRATTIMVQIARHERCREHFKRLQHRLLQFTVSHFMDLRVAAMVANILFEIQRNSNIGTTPSTVKKELDGSQKETKRTVADDDDEDCGDQQKDEDAGRRKSAEFYTSGFSLSGSEPPLFNGNANEHSAHSSSASSTTSSTNGPVKRTNGGGGRKRPAHNGGGSPTNNNNNNNNHYEKWNGHCRRQQQQHGGGEAMSSPGSSIEEEPPVEKRLKVELSSATSEQVRERMRNSILSKASLKAAAALPPKKNGWIEADEIGGGAGRAIQNGIADEGRRGAGKEQLTATPTTKTAGGANGGGSLTAVA